jgi:peroxiredoxin
MFMTMAPQSSQAAPKQLGLQVGEQAPDFEAATYDGGKVRLSEVLSKGPAVLVFYRGGWCPFCNLHLRAFQHALPGYQKAGVTVIAISVDPPQAASATVQKNDLGFDVVSDPGAAILRDYRVLAPKERNGKPLSIPATFAIDPSGRVLYAYASENPTSRSKPEKVLAVFTDSGASE